MKPDNTYIDSPRANAQRRKEIDNRNGLRNAVIRMHALYCDCPEHILVRETIRAYPFPTDGR